MWYIIYNGQTYGPMPKEALVNYGLNPNSTVWKEGLNQVNAGSVPELQSLLFPAASYAPQPPYGPQAPYMQKSDKSKIVFGILAILFGWLGVEYFYVGKIGGGIITIALCIVTCGAWELLTLIQGIVVLCMSDEDFDRKFVYSNSTFPLF